MNSEEIKDFEDDANDKWNRRIWTDDDIKKLLAALKEQEAKIEKLKNALNISRGQWIHSVNAQQCLEALSADEESK